LLAEIGEHQREGRRHAQALGDAQQREYGEVGRGRQQHGRNRQQREAQQDAPAAIDALTEERDAESGDRHAHGGGIDRKSHRGGRDAIGAGERGQDRLCGEQVDQREERGQADDERAQQRTGGMVVHVHRCIDRVRHVGHDGLPVRKE